MAFKEMPESKSGRRSITDDCCWLRGAGNLLFSPAAASRCGIVEKSKYVPTYDGEKGVLGLRPANGEGSKGHIASVIGNHIQINCSSILDVSLGKSIPEERFHPTVSDGIICVDLGLTPLTRIESRVRYERFIASRTPKDADVRGALAELRDYWQGFQPAVDAKPDDAARQQEHAAKALAEVEAELAKMPAAPALEA